MNSYTKGSSGNITITNTTATENTSIVWGGLDTSKSYQIQRDVDNYYWNGSGWQSSSTSVSPNASGYINFWNDKYSSPTTITLEEAEAGVCGYTSGDWIVTSPTVCKQDVQVDVGHKLICEDTLTMYNAKVTADGFESRTTVPLVCAGSGDCAVFS